MIVYLLVPIHGIPGYSWPPMGAAAGPYYGAPPIGAASVSYGAPLADTAEKDNPQGGSVEKKDDKA